MKRILALALALVLLLGAASADTVDGLTERALKFTRHPERRTAEEGVSPTTGLPLADRAALAEEGWAGFAVTGRYQPMLVQIDNTNSGAGDIAPWGVMYADILYEFPLASGGATRISALFSDLMPTAVGPMRSARVGAVWTLAEWDAGFMYYGYQSKKGSSVPDELTRIGAKMNEVRFNGTDGTNRPWKQYYSRRKDLPSPHNASGNAAAISTLIPDTHLARQRAFPFTKTRASGGDPADRVVIHWGSPTYEYTLVWDEPLRGYLKYCHHSDGTTEIYRDHESGEPIVFQNVIVQFARTSYNGSSAAPVTRVTGRGNAEYFQCGQHFPGVWTRPELTDQTVYYTMKRKELALQQGRTLIIMLPVQKTVSWE